MQNLDTKLSFQQENLKAINNRLKKIINAKEIGELVTSDFQGIFIYKNENALELYCYEKSSNQLSDTMSRINLDAPLELLSPYMQTAFSTALWREQPPENIYIAGFGGGCLAQEFYHFFPSSQIDGSEVDPAILNVARDYFAVPFDGRIDVHTKDGRSDFDSRNKVYDLVFVDVFFGGGSHANHLATQEFFKLCKSRMTNDGILCANIIEKDPLHAEKVAAIHDNFDHVYGWNVNGARVTFASAVPVDFSAASDRIEQFVETENVSFPITERLSEIEKITHAKNIRPLSDRDVEHLKMQLAG